MPTTYKEEIGKLTLDAGARRLAEVLDVMQRRLDSCCGAEGTATAKPASGLGRSPVSGDSSKD